MGVVVATQYASLGLAPQHEVEHRSLGRADLVADPFERTLAERAGEERVVAKRVQLSENPRQGGDAVCGSDQDVETTGWKKWVSRTPIKDAQEGFGCGPAEPSDRSEDVAVHAPEHTRRYDIVKKSSLFVHFFQTLS